MNSNHIKFEAQQDQHSSLTAADHNNAMTAKITNGTIKEEGVGDAPPSSSSNTTAPRRNFEVSSPAAEPEEEDAATFPQQLMDVVEQETKGGVTVNGKRVLEWLPSGDAFVIRDKNMMEKNILPRHFAAKCKYMSFVRKLYRWGFRQVEKDTPGIMIFMHTNFIRGDKQRCLRMRSIVKKQNSQQQAYSNFTNNRQLPMLQGMGSNMPYGMNPNMMGNQNMMGSPMGMQDRFSMQGSQMYPPSFNNQAGAGSGGMGMGMGIGDSSSVFNSGNNFPNAMGMTSTDMYRAGLQLERIEHQQQRQIQNMDMFNNGNNVPGAPPFNQSPPMPVQMPAANNYGGPTNNFGGGDITDVDVAFNMMKQNPNMEPWRALELAKRFNKK